jgi:hypothetical protein
MAGNCFLQLVLHLHLHLDIWIQGFLYIARPLDIFLESLLSTYITQPITAHHFCTLSLPNLTSHANSLGNSNKTVAMTGSFRPIKAAVRILDHNGVPACITGDLAYHYYNVNNAYTRAGDPVSQVCLSCLPPLIADQYYVGYQVRAMRPGLEGRLRGWSSVRRRHL